MDLYHKVFRVLLDAETHEAREFFGINWDEYEKPLHPHTLRGMREWAQRPASTEALIGSDITFGSA
jgi:hypothetical protein